MVGTVADHVVPLSVPSRLLPDVSTVFSSNGQYPRSPVEEIFRPVERSKISPVLNARL